MAARANWRGVLKIGEVACPVALFTAASTAERIAFHILNRKSGHRVHREYVDAETGERVEAKDQVKGYEIGETRLRRSLLSLQDLMRRITAGNRRLPRACGSPASDAG